MPLPVWLCVAVFVVFLGSVLWLCFSLSRFFEDAPLPPDTRVQGPVALGEPLGFRPVEDTVPGACEAPGGAPAGGRDGGAGRSCTADGGSTCVTVSGSGGLDVRSVAAVGVLDRTAEGQGWIVEVTLRGEDADRFSGLTGRLAERPEPKNGVAVVLGDRLIAHPAVAERLTNPTVQIAVGLGRAEARGLAESLGAR
ncbi:SecDF P1 head subdomain-containing protein [Streptomyces thermolineatus]